jgi:hypothetical protein
MMRIPSLPILLAALALTSFAATRAEAATQILGLIASNGVPTPLQCADGWFHCRTLTPLCYGSAGVRLDQILIPVLHRTRLRNRGPVTRRLVF